MRLAATYLAWVDCSGTGLSPEDGPRAHLCSAGQQFGPGGETWLRFNSATLRPILKEALERG